VGAGRDAPDGEVRAAGRAPPSEGLAGRAGMTPVRIFLSHSREDADFCRELAQALRAAGADVWYNEHGLDLGQFMAAIELEVRSRPVFVAVLSPAALGSGTVYAECAWAATYARRDPSRVFLPVLAEAVDPGALWTFLHDFQPVATASVELYPRQEAIRRTLHALALGPGAGGSRGGRGSMAGAPAPASVGATSGPARASFASYPPATTQPPVAAYPPMRAHPQQAPAAQGRRARALPPRGSAREPEASEAPGRPRWWSRWAAKR